MNDDSNSSSTSIENDIKLVSVICRTTNRKELAQALKSIASQSYAKLEIILVDALGAGVDFQYQALTQQHPNLKIHEVSNNKPLNRPSAANLGLDNCRGHYAMFLDEDDWISPSHISNLVEALEATPVGENVGDNLATKVAYCVTQKTTAAGEPIAHEIFDTPFDAALLRRDNFIPIHSALFTTQLLSLDCRFDEALDIYEDWDFWLQLSQHSGFIHTQDLTAFYREGGESSTAAEEHHKYQQGHTNAIAREKLFSKWLKRWSARDVNSMLGSMDRSEEFTKIHAEISFINQDRTLLHAQIEESHQQLHSADKELHLKQAQIDELESQVISSEESLQASQHQLAELQLSYQALDDLMNYVRNSVSWKITKPIRVIRRSLGSYLIEPVTSQAKRLIINSPRLHGWVLRNFKATEIPTGTGGDTQSSAQMGKFHFNLDSPSPVNHIYSQVLELQGWALSSNPGLKITTYIDELEYRAFKPRVSRANLTELFPQFTGASTCGFDEKIALGLFPSGPHQLRLVFSDDEGLCKEVSQEFYLFKDNGLYTAWLESNIPSEQQLLAIESNCKGDFSDRGVEIFLKDATNNSNHTATLDSLISLAQQGTADWHCQCIGTDADAVIQGLKEAGFSSIIHKLSFLDAATSIEISDAAYSLCLNAGDKLQPHGLLELVAHAQSNNADLVYCDHDSIDHKLDQLDAEFTFEWSPSHLLSRNYIGGVFLFSNSLWEQSEFKQLVGLAWRFQLLLSLTNKAAKISRVAQVLWSEPELSATAKQESLSDELAKVETHLAVNNITAKVETRPYGRYIDYPLTRSPLVSIIIPTMGRLDLVQPCIESLLEKTLYKNYEIIILDNGRGAYPEGIAYLTAQGFKVIECNEAFNWSRLNNIGAGQAQGELLLFLNDDIEVEHGNWLEELVKQAQHEDVGAVGGLLYFPNGAIQHAGVFLVNYGGGGLHLFHKMMPGHKIYRGLHGVVREVSANTGACLLVSRDKFDELNGFDEALHIVGNDVDFCLRLHKAGYRNIWTPECQLIHHESISREATVPRENEQALWKRWGKLFTSGDPYYNPNLSLQKIDCSLNAGAMLSQLAQDSSLFTAPPSRPETEMSSPEQGVNLIAYIRAEMGLGEGGRSDARALQAADIDFGIINFETDNPARMTDLSWQHKEIINAPFDINLLHINADYLPLARREMPAHFFKDRYTIGYWAWELEEIPDNWLTAFQDVDEVWVPSHFVKAAVEKKSPVPVTVIPHCVQIKPTLEPGRDYFGIPAESFVFLSMFDSRSIAQRKNPYAAIEAFKQAFKAFDADDPQSPCLVLKLNNANAEDIEQLEALMAGYKLVLLTKHHSRAEINALLSIMDCYVSLHRSEGFGLAPAEAMSLGKVALLTNWSGNTDYMTADNCLPIDYTLITIKEDAGPYKAGQRWADANIDHAARAMAKIVAEPELRKQIGAAAKATIEKSFSPLAVGEMIKKRLDQIRKQRANI